jgi:DNA-binding transcriptional ArsR family regulator
MPGTATFSNRYGEATVLSGQRATRAWNSGERNARPSAAADSHTATLIKVVLPPMARWSCVEIKPGCCFMNAASSAHASSNQSASSGATLNLLINTTGSVDCWSCSGKTTRSSIYSGLPLHAEYPCAILLNRMVQYARARLDASFAALSDATRRGVLEQLGRADASITDLAVKFHMTLTGMKKHVGVLEQAGLVTTEKVGRVRTCKLGLRRLEEESAWIERYRQRWEARFDELDKVVEELKRKEKVDGRKKSD